MTEQEELEYLKQNSPMALPDDPSSSGWSAAQIKEKHYAGLFFLYNLFKANRQNLNQAVSDMQEIVDSINEEYEEIINGKNVSAKWDDENNEIKTTYAKILNITNGTIKVLKYIKENGTDDYIYNIEKNLSTLTTNFNTLKAWTDNLKDINSDTSVLRAVQATKDGLGNIINETYATIASLNLTSASITNIVNGTTIVGKAYNDQLGRRIDTTYIRIADIINVLNDTSTNKPLSAAMGKSLQQQINAINTLLASDDTDLDTIQEIITYIKNNKTLIENITSDKMSYSVLVHNLTTNNDNLPLSASMGYALKAMIDAINDVEDGIEAAEALRVIAEAGRVEAEEARQTGYSGFDSRITANEDDIEDLQTAVSGLENGKQDVLTFDNTPTANSNNPVKSGGIKTYIDNGVSEAKSYVDKVAKNLQWQLGTYDLGVETVNGTTSLLPTPANTIQATMVRVDGKSEVCSNLCPTATYSGIMNNTIAKSIDLGNLPLGTYTISFNVLANADNRIFIGYYVNNGVVDSEHNINTSLNGTGQKSYTFTLDGTIPYDDIRLGINTGTLSYSVSIENLMLNKGSTALSYEPYFDGIHNLELSGLKVEGSNLLDLTQGTNGYINDSGEIVVRAMQFASDYIKVKGGQTYIAKTSQNFHNIGITYYDSNKNIILPRTDNPSSSQATITPSVNGYIRIWFNVDNTTSINSSIQETYSIRLNRGSTALPYEAYVSTTKTIDLSTILYNGSPLFEENSLKGVGTAKDYITPYKAHKEVGAIQIKNIETINYNSEYQVFYFYITSKKQGDVIMADFKTVSTAYQSMNNLEISGSSSANGINVKDTSCADATAFKTKYGDYWLLFQLATPIEVSIDWSDKLSRQTCYSNGSITLLNTNNQDTTSTFKYLKEVAK